MEMLIHYTGLPQGMDQEEFKLAVANTAAQHPGNLVLSGEINPEDNLPEEFHRKTLLPEREDAEGRIEFRTADRQLPGKGVGIFKAEAERGETELPAAEILVQVAALDEKKVPGRDPQESPVQTSPVESLQRQHDLRFGVPVAADGIGAPCHNGKIENMEFQRKGFFRRRGCEECRFAKILIGHDFLR